MNTFTQFGLGSRAIVTVEQGLDSFSVYLPKVATPKDIATVIAAIAPKSRPTFVAGEVIADFIQACNPAAQLQLLSQRRLTEFLGKSDALYLLNYAAGYMKVTVRKANTPSVTPLFEGNVYNFVQWASRLTGLESLVLKTVQFAYNGGSKPGAKRTIRVEKVGNDGASAYIEGYDLSEAELKTAYKRYNLEKMPGGISLLN